MSRAQESARTLAAAAIILISFVTKYQFSCLKGIIKTKNKYLKYGAKQMESD